MKNGQYPPDRETTDHRRKLQKLVMDLAESIDFVEQAVMMLFGSLIDLSNRTGKQKDEHNKRVKGCASVALGILAKPTQAAFKISRIDFA
jgi:hypothetical protein